jgi:hypothetical protein
MFFEINAHFSPEDSLDFACAFGLPFLMNEVSGGRIT